MSEIEWLGVARRLDGVNARREIPLADRLAIHNWLDRLAGAIEAESKLCRPRDCAPWSTG
jgi:hypothetical protein